MTTTRQPAEVRSDLSIRSPGLFALTPFRRFAPAWAALLILLFAGWCGTFYAGAGSVASGVAVVAMLAVTAWGARGRDPLELGGWWWMPWLFVAWVAISLVASPVSRAGWEGALLLPAGLGVAAAVTRSSREGADRRRLLSAMGGTAGLLGLWSLAEWGLRGEGSNAMPLGHHLLLGLVLVGLFPFAVERARVRGRVWWLVPVAVVAAALGTGSTLVVVGLLVEVVLLLPRPRRRQGILALSILLALTTVFLRFGSWNPDETSLRARWTYWDAGWNGSLERPWFGWGPGSTPWTLALHQRPVPAVNPPGDLVGDLHSLPLQVLYELGWPGLFLALATIAVWVRARRRREGDRLAVAAGVGLVGCLIVSLGGVTLGTRAPWVLTAVLAGCVAGPGSKVSPPSGRDRSRVGWIAYALLAVILLAPLLGARYAYDRARVATSPPGAVAWLARAESMDPGFPLYRARLGWLLPGAEGAQASLGAAESAMGVADLWLAAGASEALSEGASERALLTACALDPFSAVPSFLAAARAPNADLATRRAARALASEPLLAAAAAWGRELPPLSAAVARLTQWPGIEAGWREAAKDTLYGLPSGGPTVRLVREVDGDPATAMSLHLFRRLPWPADVASVTLWREALEEIDLPRPVEMPGTGAEAFGECE